MIKTTPYSYDVQSTVRNLTIIRDKHFRESPAAVEEYNIRARAGAKEINEQIAYLQEWDLKIAGIGPKVLDGNLTLAEVLEYMEKHHDSLRVGQVVMHFCNYSWRWDRQVPIYRILYFGANDDKKVEMSALTLEWACKKFNYLLKLWHRDCEAIRRAKMVV